MADATPPASGWDVTHIATVIGLGAVGAAAAPVLAPAALVGALGYLGISSVAAVGAVVGGYMGHKIAKPS